MKFKLRDDKFWVLLFIDTSDELTQGIFASFYDLAFVAGNLLENKNLTVARWRHSAWKLCWKRSADSASEERTKGRVVTERKFNFLQVYAIIFGVGPIDGLSEHAWNMHFCDHLSLFGEGGLQSFLNGARYTLRMNSDVTIVAKFLAKADLRTMGLFSDIFSA